MCNYVFKHCFRHLQQLIRYGKLVRMIVTWYDILRSCDIRSSKAIVKICQITLTSDMCSVNDNLNVLLIGTRAQLNPCYLTYSEHLHTFVSCVNRRSNRHVHFSDNLVYDWLLDYWVGLWIVTQLRNFVELHFKLRLLCLLFTCPLRYNIQYLLPIQTHYYSINVVELYVFGKQDMLCFVLCHF